MHKRLAMLMAGCLATLALTGITAGTASARELISRGPEMPTYQEAQSWIPDYERACRKYGTVTRSWVETNKNKNPWTYQAVVGCDIKN